MPLLGLILVTVIAYANAWPNALVADDPTFAVSDRFSGIGLQGFLRFFVNDLWAVNGVDSGLYRPLLLVSILIDAKLFGDWVAGYHLVNILLHVVMTVLVYGLAHRLLTKMQSRPAQPHYLAFLTAVIFAVHPIHAEVVNSIFNRSEMLVSIGTVGGLWWFLQAHDTSARKAWIGLGIAYLLILLCKESGAMLPALAVVLLWTTLTGTWQLKLQKCLPVFFLVIPLAIYILLRANALDRPEEIDEAPSPATEQVSELLEPSDDTEQLSGESIETVEPAIGWVNRFSKQVIENAEEYDTSRISHAVRMWADAWKMMFWPHPLLLFHGQPDTALATASVLQVILLGLAILGYIRGSPGLIIGVAFFYISIFPSSGIVGPLAHPQLAERFLYLPSVGLSITLGFALRATVPTVGLRSATAAVLILAAMLTPLTWSRNAEWSSDLLLSEAEYQRGMRKGPIVPALVVHNMKAKNVARALGICQQHGDSGDKDLSFQCGFAYQRVGRYRDAEHAFLVAARHPMGAGKAYVALALMSLRLDNRADARKYFEKSIAVAHKPFLREYMTALMLIQLYPRDRAKLLEARNHLERSLQLLPEYYPARRTLEQVDERLRRAGEPGNRVRH